MSYNVCRFCGKRDREDAHRLALIHYSVRHYAHPDCLLKAKGADAFPMLHDWQLDQFPVLAADRHRLMELLIEQCRSRKERTA